MIVFLSDYLNLDPWKLLNFRGESSFYIKLKASDFTTLSVSAGWGFDCCQLKITLVNIVYVNKTTLVNIDMCDIIKREKES